MNDAQLAARWYEAWNAHDLDAIMALYSDDIEFSSPYAASLGLSKDGLIIGRTRVRAYFELALARAPGLRFIPDALFVGARGHTLIYRNHRGERAAEHHQTNAVGLITRADATYETL